VDVNEVRAFGELVDPSVYRQGYGLQGWLVYHVNRIRAYLERWIILRVLRLRAADAGWSTEEQKELISAARSDPTIRPFLPRGRSKRDSFPLDRTSTDSQFNDPKERAVSHYGEGRKNGPVPLEEGAFRETALLANSGRFRSERRYSGGRQHIVFDDCFEPVGKE
jgi:hypothetical protein